MPDFEKISQIESAHFKEVSRDQAEAELMKMSAGSFIIRPPSDGGQQLVISYRGDEGKMNHVLVDGDKVMESLNSLHLVESASPKPSK